MPDILALEKIGVVAALCFAVWWLNRLNQKQQIRLDDERKLLDKERASRIDSLEKRASQCEKDRAELSKEIVELKLKLGG